MKKFFLFSILSTVLFISCSNLHFNDSTSVSLYLPELNGNTNNQNARSIEFRAGYDPSEYYYEVNLNLRGTTKYKQISPGGTTITFSGIQPGDYEVECKACVKKGVDLFVIAQKLKEVTALRGRLTVVDLALNGVPVIKQQLVPHIFNFSYNDGVSFSVINNTLPESYEVEWFIDGKPYTNFNLPEKNFSFNTQNANGDGLCVFSLETYSQSDPGLPFGPHSLYAKITDKANGSFVRTDVVDIYFGGNFEYTITPVLLDVKFKGADNTYPLVKTLSLADFSGTVTYSVQYNQTSVGNITIHYDSFPENGDLGIGIYKGIINMTGNQYALGLQDYSFTIDDKVSPLATVRIKRTYYQELYRCFTFPDHYVNISPYPGQQNQDLRLERVFDSIPETPAESYQWFKCDATGNIISTFGEETSIGAVSLNGFDETGVHYFICKITLSGLSDACLNAPGGQVVFYSPVYTVTVSE